MRLKLRSDGDVKKLIKKKKVVKLHLGCGTDYKDGWINIDNNSDNNIEGGKLDLNWDLRNPLPFEDSSVDYIFNEHFYEHLSPEEAVASMKDMRRVLKSGGVMRIAMPDLEQVIDTYLHTPLEKDSTVKEFNLEFVETPAELVNMAFRWWGHKWLYDWEELQRRLKEAGFSKMVRVKNGESSHKNLLNLETREGSHLVVEVTK